MNSYSFCCSFSSSFYPFEIIYHQFYLDIDELFYLVLQFLDLEIIKNKILTHVPPSRKYNMLHHFAFLSWQTPRAKCIHSTPRYSFFEQPFSLHLYLHKPFHIRLLSIYNEEKFALPRKFFDFSVLFEHFLHIMLILFLRIPCDIYPSINFYLRFT